MTQRIFNMENLKDIKDLFDILPDAVCGVSANHGGYFTTLHYQNSPIKDAISHLIVKFGKKDYVERPYDESTWIGCLCWFWDYEPERKYLGILKEIADTGARYIKNNNSSWLHCQPAMRDEIKFAEDKVNLG